VEPTTCFATMFSDVAYHQQHHHNHHNQPQLQPHQLDQRSFVGFFDSLPSSPAAITSRNLPYNDAHARQSHQASTHPSRQYALPLQRTNSYPPRESLGSPQGRSSDASEHMLRRKTPSGTLAAGYDGTPVGWASDSHVMKHVLVPFSNVDNVRSAHQGLSKDKSPYRSFTPSSNHPRSEHAEEYNRINHDYVGGVSEINESMMRIKWLHKPGYSPSIDSFLDQIPAHQGQAYFLPNGQQIPTVLQPAWQPCLGPTASIEPGPYGPYWPNGSFIPYRPAALRDPRFFSHAGRGWIPSYEDERTGYHNRGWQPTVGVPSMTSAGNDDPAYYPPQSRFDPTGSPGMPASTEYPFRQASSSYASQTLPGNQNLANATRGYQAYLGHAAQYRPSGPTGQRTTHGQGSDTGYSTPPTPLISYDVDQTPVTEFGMQSGNAQFREKVLSWAHRVYIDLLASLHQSRKASFQGKQNDSKRNLPRANIYPRPPRQPRSDFSTHISDLNAWRSRSPQVQAARAIGCEEHISKKPKQDNGVNDYFASAASERRSTSLWSPSADSFQDRHITQQYEEHSPLTFSFLRPTPSNCCTLRRTSGSGTFSHNVQPQQEQSPSTNAMAALDMLTKLCQESGWLWIDGMLLGGCLAYGLGDYHKASGWYFKILANDSR